MPQQPPITLLDEFQLGPQAAVANSHSGVEIRTESIVADVTKFLLESKSAQDIRLASAAANLALDEALLDAAEAGLGTEVLRLWQFPEPTAVLGRGSKVEIEIDRDQCRLQNIPIMRRCSGGASIVAGPGCLMYSIVLDMQNRPQLRKLDEAHQFVMQSLANSLNRLLASLESTAEQISGEQISPDQSSGTPNSKVKVQGTCDLTIENRKFSGNSLRVARNHLLYHGTFLYAANLQQISESLRTPPRQPDYREKRDHSGFIINISLDRGLLCQAIADAFSAQHPATGQRHTATGQDEISISRYNEMQSYLAAQTKKLAVERYCQSAWIMRH